MAWPDLAPTYYRHWKTAEAVTLTQAGTGGQTFSVAKAMRAPPETRSEKQPTGARYLVTEMIWRVPGPLLPARTVLYPGDRLTADEFFRQTGTGTDVWTILRTSYNHLDAVWELDCTLLGLHPRFADTITIQRPHLDGTTGFLPLDAAGGEIFSVGDGLPG